MIDKLGRYLRTLRGSQRINMSLMRGHIGSSRRNIDLADPSSWEFTGFSQNGEDGIIEVLLAQLKNPNRYFIEIGSSDGLENNTCWLSMVRRYSGLWIEGDQTNVDRAREMFEPLNHGVVFERMMVTPSTAGSLAARAAHLNPDVFSLDIDSFDYFVARSILEAGFRPKIFAVEYNSAYGPERAITIAEGPFATPASAVDRLYYGCSIQGWRKLFASFGYSFVTVDMNGVNAFFVDPAEFDENFLHPLNGLTFAENFAQRATHGGDWRSQWKLIAGREFTEVA